MTKQIKLKSFYRDLLKTDQILKGLVAENLKVATSTIDTYIRTNSEQLTLFGALTIISKHTGKDITHLTEELDGE